jgi:hypothetical protein
MPPVSPDATVRVPLPSQLDWLKLDTQRRADLNRCAYAVVQYRDGSACALPLIPTLATIAPAFEIVARIHPTIDAATLDAIDPNDLA